MIEQDLLFIFLFGFIGGSLKYIDASYDDGVFNHTIALALTPITGMVFCGIIALNEYAAGIYLGIVISVILTGKIDNFAFSLIIAMILTTVIILGVSGSLQVSIPTLLVILACSGIDEIGNDRADQELQKSDLQDKPIGFKGLLHSVWVNWFMFRTTTSAGMVILILLFHVPWIFFFALIAEECLYQIVESYAQKRKNLQGVTC